MGLGDDTPASNNNGEGIIRTKILLLGLRRSGKTSIQKVLFENMPPKETFYLETTMRIEKHVFDTAIPLEIWDCPGNVTADTLGAPLAHFASMIFVIDIRDDIRPSIAKLSDFIIAAFDQNPQMNIEIFLHKAEKWSEDDKLESLRQVDGRIADRLADQAPDYTQQPPINIQITSIYDHTLLEAFSRVLHKLITSLPYLEELLNAFCATSQASKAFLFDVRSKLYVATDASPADSATHNLCCDYLQMLNSFSSLYRSASASSLRHRSFVGEPRTPPPSTVSSPMLDRESAETTAAQTEQSSQPQGSGAKSWFYPSAATRLLPGTTVTFHVVTPELALVALIPTSVFESRRGLVEYNVIYFREGVQEICDAEAEARLVGRRG